METASNIINLVVVPLSLLVVILQLWFAIRNQRYSIYTTVNTEWIHHMTRVMSDPELEGIWEIIPWKTHEEWIQAQRQKGIAGAWSLMSPERQKCYRYIRIALDIFELGYQSIYHGVRMSKTLRTKWDNQLKLFIGNPYFPYVFIDTAPRLDSQFAKRIRELVHEGNLQFFPEKGADTAKKVIRELLTAR